MVFVIGIIELSSFNSISFVAFRGTRGRGNSACATCGWCHINQVFGLFTFVKIAILQVLVFMARAPRIRAPTGGWISSLTNLFNEFNW
jgi:hypothetical protein